MMSQFPAFFHDTLRENLRIAKPNATDEELISICRTTGMLDILEAKGLTLDSNLAGGQILSGGQKKLLALTRCLLRMPAILFLDEPTAVRRLDRDAAQDWLDRLLTKAPAQVAVVGDLDGNRASELVARYLATTCERPVLGSSPSEELRTIAVDGHGSDPGRFRFGQGSPKFTSPRNVASWS
jgi:ABC-type iron transport system FetAB ATPase subunit